MTLRDRILDAAAVVLREKGLAAATTKEIARVAGCAEGSIYTYFPDKEALFVAVLAERLPRFIPLMKDLLGRAGEGSLRDQLIEVAATAIAFYGVALPLSIPALAMPDIRAGLRRMNRGPHLANESLATYLRLEQRLGRLRPDLDVAAAAALLLGACQLHAFQMLFLGRTLDVEESTAVARDFVGTLLSGMAPKS